jgi:dienelactone hydrolase
LIDSDKADLKRVYVLGRSNGATTSLIIMNNKIGISQKNKFAGAFPMQPSCRYMGNVEFYAPVHLFLAEKDDWTDPVMCQNTLINRTIPAAKAKIWKGATHGYEDRGPTYVFHGHKLEYNAEASEGTIKAIINVLNSHEANSTR